MQEEIFKNLIADLWASDIEQSKKTSLDGILMQIRTLGSFDIFSSLSVDKLKDEETVNLLREYGGAALQLSMKNINIFIK
ncbi:MAG: hypothetical protein COB67_00655 [SAR324 cluster bacterium]|uniref:Uncharacterized protein n=1 Tax=SAR324 cluster bacterium TaxID=2024889 RepID=A0A2A4TDG3_9DELT|nr:MAG: hypothetical protein COB67_00655 [SAR324 cluster bacterium]